MTVRVADKIFLSIIIPAYNEEKRIGPSLKAICAYLAGKPFGSEIIVVDDGSTDRTAEVVLATLEGRIPFKLVEQDSNLGKGRAVKEGVFASSGEIILFSDADLSTPIEEFDKFLQRFDEGFDVVIGSRAIPGCDVRIRQAAPREALGKFFNRLVQMFVFKGCPDTQCGFKAFRRQAAVDIFSRLTTKGFAFDVEILLLARKLKYKIHEVPVVWCNRPPSHVRIVRSSWQMLKDLWQIRRLR